MAREIDTSLAIKSGLIVGLGEEIGEIESVMEDLMQIGCDLLTIGQYLSPSKHHYPVQRFLVPSEFDDLADKGRAMGFKGVIAGFYVRSSYRAQDLLQRC